MYLNIKPNLQMFRGLFLDYLDVEYTMNDKQIYIGFLFF